MPPSSARAGIPSVLFGPGGAGLHSTEEYVNVDDVVRLPRRAGVAGARPADCQLSMRLRAFEPDRTSLES